MKIFLPLLKSINQKLDLPQPQKSRILVEIASDLEDLYCHYRKQGFSEEESVNKAAEKLSLSETALQELVRIHGSGFRKVMDRLSEQSQKRWERVTLFSILLFIFIPTTKVLISSEIFANMSVFVWPISFIGSTVLIFFIIKFYFLFIKKEHDIRKIGKGLSVFLFLAAASLFISLWGFYVELYSLPGNTILHASNPFLLLILNTSNRVDAEILQYVSLWLIRSSFMVMMGIVVAICSGLFWFILGNKVMRIEESETAYIMQD